MQLNKETRKILKRILTHLQKHICNHESLNGSFEGYLGYFPWNGPGGEGFLEWHPELGILLVDRWVEGRVQRKGYEFHGYIRLACVDDNQSKEVHYIAYNLRDALARLWMEGVNHKQQHLGFTT